MKTSSNLKIGLLSILSFCSLQVLAAQNCDSFYPLKKGNSFEMQEFDAQNKLQGSDLITVIDRKDIGGTAEATMQATHTDSKGKAGTPVEFKVKCDGAVFYMDLQTFASNMEKNKDMEMKMEGGFSEMPVKNMKAGDQLKDAVMKMHMLQKGKEMGLMVMTIRRKVEAKESVTVPAGTFECFKIDVETESAMEMMGMKMPAGKNHHVEYFSAGVGTVKSEFFDKNGKLMRYSVLSKITK